MAFQHTIDEKRAAMCDAVRTELMTGRLVPGAKLPSVRALAERHGVSVKVACQAIETLMDEGHLHSVARKGLFAGTARREFQVFLYTMPWHHGHMDYLRQAQLGFEGRVAQMGGVSLVMTEPEACEQLERGTMPPLAGIFRLEVAPGDGAWWPEGVPCVEFGELGAHGTSSDRLRFEDAAGARQATAHLIAQGHRGIAYLAMHTRDGQPQSFVWSEERQNGWREVMEAAGIETTGLSICPQAPASRPLGDAWSNPMQYEVTYAAVRRHIVGRREITAVLTANVIAAAALIAALRDVGVAEEQWPAMVCFDDVTFEASAVMTYMSLPWDELGRAAAQLLWERSSGQTSGPPQQRLVPMRLIRRLSCDQIRSSQWTASLVKAGQLQELVLGATP